MNKLSNILLATFVALFLLSFGIKSEAVAQCEPEFTPKTVNFNVGGCTWSVDICYRCSPLGMGATKVKILSGPILIQTSPPCHSTVPVSGVLNYVLSQIQSPSFILNELCSYSPPAPPCDGPEDPITVKYYIPQCWQAEVVMYFNQKTVHFIACSDDICEVTELICVDGNGAYVRTQLPPIGTDTPTCTVEGDKIIFPDPENLGPFDVGYTTPCYIYHSACNP